MKQALDQSAFVLAARELLTKGDAEGAEKILAPIFNGLKSDAAVLHLMGLIKKARNQLDEAERLIRSAIAYSLSEGSYYNELGVLLQMRGAYDEALKVFRAALALLPEADTIRSNIARCLLEAGEVARAEQEASTLVSLKPSAENWSLLAQVQRASGKHAEALLSLESAVKCDPQARATRLAYGKALDRAGRAEEALDIFETLASRGVDSRDLAMNFARALYAAERKHEAREVVEKGLEKWPAAADLHGLLARMRWLAGEGVRCTARMEAEIAKRPQDIHLRLACADVHHRVQDYPKAFEILRDAAKIAPDAPALLTALGIVLDDLGRPLDGLNLLRRAAQLTNGAQASIRNLLSTSLRAGQPEEALRLARALREQEPDEQYLIACEATALRMLGDPAYKDWCDCERYVREYDLPAPRGYFTAESFNATLAGFLRPQHKANAHPLDQYLPNSTQTGRDLLEWDEHAIKLFLGAADAAVRDYVGRLEHAPDHPLKRRKSRNHRYGGLWSVRQAQDGYHPAHVHDRGWISSVYFAALMPAERPRNPRSGWLQFGEPNRPPRGCGPERWVEPKVGRLVLFPSYFWHGTAPFEGAERLSMAFDVVPG